MNTTFNKKKLSKNIKRKIKTVEKKMIKAEFRGVRNITARERTKIIREVSSMTKIPQKVIKGKKITKMGAKGWKRIRYREPNPRTQKDPIARIFLDIKPIPLSSVRPPKSRISKTISKFDLIKGRNVGNSANVSKIFAGIVRDEFHYKYPSQKRRRKGQPTSTGKALYFQRQTQKAYAIDVINISVNKEVKQASQAAIKRIKKGLNREILDSYKRIKPRAKSNK